MTPNEVLTIKSLCDKELSGTPAAGIQLPYLLFSTTMMAPAYYSISRWPFGPVLQSLIEIVHRQYGPLIWEQCRPLLCRIPSFLKHRSCISLCYLRQNSLKYQPSKARTRSLDSFPVPSYQNSITQTIVVTDSESTCSTIPSHQLLTILYYTSSKQCLTLIFARGLTLVG